MPPINAVTPVRATIHYDDYARQWHLHASRLEFSSNGDHRDIVKENFDTFSELLVLLLQLWVLSGSVTGDTEFKAPIGDLSAVGAAITSGPLSAEAELPVYIDIGPPGDFNPPPNYDGVADNWGMAP